MLKPLIEFKNVCKTYSSAERPSVNNVSLSVYKGECLALIGASGSGKTSLLKMLNGLESPSSGTILIQGKSIAEYNIRDLRRSFFGYVFQKGGLFPHLTVQENIEIVLRFSKSPPKNPRKKIENLLNLIHLDPETYLERYPEQLSGGEQQRVGVARALATDSKCLLMDEPFGALDVVTRSELQDEILNVKNNLNKTIIFVTHDINEAFKLGDRIAVMQDGAIEQIGLKEQLSDRPKTTFVEKLVSIGLGN